MKKTDAKKSHATVPLMDQSFSINDLLTNLQRGDLYSVHILLHSSLGQPGFSYYVSSGVLCTAHTGETNIRTIPGPTVLPQKVAWF